MKKLRFSRAPVVVMSQVVIGRGPAPLEEFEGPFLHDEFGPLLEAYRRAVFTEDDLKNMYRSIPEHINYKGIWMDVEGKDGYVWPYTISFEVSGAQYIFLFPQKEGTGASRGVELYTYGGKPVPAEALRIANALAAGFRALAVNN